MMSEKNEREGSTKTFWRKYPWLVWIWPVLGLFSLLWFLIRVVPKPSRATYPCQRVAFPLASSFIIWLLGMSGSAVAFRKAKSSFVRSRYVVGLLCIVVSIGCVWLSLALTAEKEAVAAEPQPVNSPIGDAKGIYPGRVIWVHDANATTWEGWDGVSDGYWWESEHTDQEVIDTMVHNAICGLAGKSNISDAWDALFRYFNIEKGKGDVGYQSGEKIIIKVNFVGLIDVWPPWTTTDYDEYSNYPDTAPQIIHAILDQLVNVAGVDESKITVGDTLGTFVDVFYDMLQPDFPDVNYLDNRGQNGRISASPSEIPFYWSTSNADGKTQDYVPNFFANANYLINIANLKGHYDQAGVTLCAKNHYGSLGRRPDGGWPNPPGNYYNLHSGLLHEGASGMGYYRPLVDLMGHEHIGGKTLLYLIDGLYSGKHALSYPQNLPRKWQMEPFNNDWPSSIFASLDPVAIDSVGFDFLYREWPENPGPGREGADDYLHEAAEANDPPSGTFYDPEDDGTRLESLGVHEHWNNPIDKQYTRNLGTGDGIELLKVSSIADADFDDDGAVNLIDFSMLAQYWQESNELVDVAPIPVSDGIVNFEDLVVLSESWLVGATP